MYFFSDISLNDVAVCVRSRRAIEPKYSRIFAQHSMFIVFNVFIAISQQMKEKQCFDENIRERANQ